MTIKRIPKQSGGRKSQKKYYKKKKYKKIKGGSSDDRPLGNVLMNCINFENLDGDDEHSLYFQDHVRLLFQLLKIYTPYENLDDLYLRYTFKHVYDYIDGTGTTTYHPVGDIEGSISRLFPYVLDLNNPGHKYEYIYFINCFIELSSETNNPSDISIDTIASGINLYLQYNGFVVLGDGLDKHNYNSFRAGLIRSLIDRYNFKKIEYTDTDALKKIKKYKNLEGESIIRDSKKYRDKQLKKLRKKERKGTMSKDDLHFKEDLDIDTNTIIILQKPDIYGRIILSNKPTTRRLKSTKKTLRRSTIPPKRYRTQKTQRFSRPNTRRTRVRQSRR